MLVASVTALRVATVVMIAVAFTVVIVDGEMLMLVIITVRSVRNAQNSL